MRTINKRVQVAFYQREKEGATHCGDSYFYTETENEFVCVIADGLGTGEFAEESSQIAIDIIRSDIHATKQQLMKRCNKQLQGKRGVVLGILKIDFNSQKYSFSSIGNISLIIITADKKKQRNIPNRGFLAGYKRTFTEMQRNLEPKMNFIMYSDGVSDADLSKDYFLIEDVHELIDTFSAKNKGPRVDDTTIIAMRYIK